MNIEQERAEFEAWAKKHGQPVFMDDDEPGCYAYSNVQDNWEGWKARAAPSHSQQSAVQGEPVAWVTVDNVDGQTVNGKPRRVWRENNEGVGMPIFAAPQPAPDVPALVAIAREIVDLHAKRNVVLTVHVEALEDALAAHRNEEERHE